MPDFRIADTAPEHRKLRSAGLAAAGLWALAGAYAMRELTDGWVPDYWVQTWPNGKKSGAALVAAGLWKIEERGGLPGYRFHDWLDYQRSEQQFASERYANKLRRELYSSPQLVAAVKDRDLDECRYCGRTVGWTNRRGSAGATLDHVVPPEFGGGNTLENVVVACRGCNAGKRCRTPEQAGMTLRPPPHRPPPPGPSTGTSSNPDHSQNGARPPSRLELEKNSSPYPNPSGIDLGGDRPEVNAPARVTTPPHKPLTSENRPPERCTQHRDIDADPGPCRGCLKAREHAEQWDEQHRTAALMAARHCQLCDAEGWRYELGTRVPLTPYEHCDHRPLRSVS